MFRIVMIVCLAGAVSAGHNDGGPKCTLGSYQIIGKADCSGYYLCVFGKPVEMPPCPKGSVFSTTAHVCVPVGSIYDDCKKTEVPVTDTMPVIPDAGPLSIQEQCTMYGGIIPHPTECQAYYNCSMWYDVVPRYLEQHMMECSYPQLFNADTKRCDHFENVKCGSRAEYKDGCDYRSNQCPVAHCIPCSVRLPSCEGKADGINAHETKLWSPYYVVCYKERNVKEEMCQADDNGRTQLFHPDKNECVSLEMIPRERGGMMPDCRSKADGFYLDDFGRCDRYVHCQAGTFVNMVQCGPGEAFDALKSVCMPKGKVCGPCGVRANC